MIRSAFDEGEADACNGDGHPKDERQHPQETVQHGFADESATVDLDGEGYPHEEDPRCDRRHLATDPFKASRRFLCFRSSWILRTSSRSMIQ